MKNTCLTFSVLGIALLFAACSKNNSSPANSASVMFVNACNGSVNIDTKVNGTKLSSASNLAYFSNSGYQNVSSGTNVPVNFYLTAQGTPLCNGAASLITGAHYSIFAGGIITTPSFVVTTDDMTAPTSGNAKVRLINLSSDALNESLYIGTQGLDSNIAYNTCSPFFEVPASMGQVLVQDPLKPTKVASIANQSLLAGKIYTIMISGTSLGTGTAILTLTVINNN